MEPLPPPPTHRLRSCRLLPPRPSTSIRCTANACQTVILGTARPPSITPSTRPKRSYLQNGHAPGRTVWEHPLDKTPAFCLLRARKHRNNYHIQAFRVQSMAANSSRGLRHISTCSTLAPLPAYRQSSRTRLLPPKVELSACKQHRHLHFRLASKTLPLRPPPRIPNMGVGSTLLRMGARRMRRPCHMLPVQISPLVLRSGRAVLVHLQSSTTKILKLPKI